MAQFFSDQNVTVALEDLGDTWQLDGIVIGDGKHSLIMQLPAGTFEPDHFSVFEPTIEQLETWMKQSDDPIAPLYHDKDSLIVKAVVRKVTRQLDQAIVWKCYERDNYTCVYCGKSGVPLTYDHYEAQAFGGQTTLENGRTSCRPCNKKKGHMTVEQWTEFARSRGLNDGATITAAAQI